MNTETIRLNITIPKDLAHALNRFAGPRKRSQFIAEAVRLQIEKKGKEELEKILEEGYRASAQESLAITKEFEVTDLEGWNEY
jgi:metal-responsive CopG/Arc/MetJ family transcriptional regulator